MGSESLLGARVALVEDHRLLAQSLAVSLRAAGCDAVLVDPGSDVVESVRQTRADVVLLDLELGDVKGDDLVGPLSRVAPVIVVTGETGRARWGRCIASGAVGVLSKEEDVERILQAVSRALAGDEVVSQADRVRWLRESDYATREAESRLAPFRRLTPREQEVLGALVDGKAAATIAREAVVSEATVRTQIRAVLTKLGVGSQLEAVATAHRARWRR